MDVLRDTEAMLKRQQKALILHSKRMNVTVVIVLIALGFIFFYIEYTNIKFKIVPDGFFSNISAGFFGSAFTFVAIEVVLNNQKKLQQDLQKLLVQLQKVNLLVQMDTSFTSEGAEHTKRIGRMLEYVRDKSAEAKIETHKIIIDLNRMEINRISSARLNMQEILSV